MSIENFGLVGATTQQTAMAFSGSNNTKGAYTELVAATANSFEGVVLLLSRMFAPRDFLIDLAVGGAGSEIVIVPNIGLSATGGNEYRIAQPRYFPIRVPKGSRLSARVQVNNITSAALNLSGYGLLANGVDGHRAIADDVVTMGANASDSGGVLMPGVDSASGFGAWTEIVASSARQFSALIPHIGLVLNATSSSGLITVEIGIGSAGNEVAIGTTSRYRNATNDTVIDPCGPIIPVNIPAGSRISARVNYGSAGTNASKQVDLILHGV